MQFYDFGMSYGKWINYSPLLPCETMEGVVAEIDRAGLCGALVYNVAADVSGAAVGNRLLSEDLRRAPDGVYGIWTLLPPCTRELPPAAELPCAMREARIRALRINPSAHRYLPRMSVLGDYLEMARERRIPVFFDTGCGITLEQIDDVLSDCPGLTAAVSLSDCWPNGRRLYDLLERHDGLHIQTSFMFTDQCFEEMVPRFGSGRLLFGSGFPAAFTGAGMMQIRHADLSTSDRQAIAGGNFLRLIEGADLS